LKKSWESVLVAPQTPLSEAIALMDKEGLRIVLVVDDHRRLLGTLTDGDVRRALLHGLPLQHPTIEAMCRTPRVARQDWDRAEIMALLERHELLHAPVLDADERVVGLETLHSLLQRRRFDNPVFLMAGGFGTRLKPLTDDCPKPLVRVGSKPILELILERFVDAGFHRFFVSTHYMPEKIREHFGDGSRWDVSIRYIHEDSPLGTGGALGLLPPESIELPLVMMNADLLTHLDFTRLVEYHNEHPATATLCVTEYTHRVPYGVVRSEHGKLQSIDEKPLQRSLVSAGIYVLSPSLVRSVQPGVAMDMPSLLQSLVERGETVNIFPIHEYWLDIGRMDDLQRARDELDALR
jgi:dTDP-glucose pyrophosphorylase